MLALSLAIIAWCTSTPEPVINPSTAVRAWFSSWFTFPIASVNRSPKGEPPAFEDAAEAEANGALATFD
jgi:hypothetical protein